MTGKYLDLHQSGQLSDSIYAFLRFDKEELVIAAANFSQSTTENIQLKIIAEVIQELGIVDGNYAVNEHIEGIQQLTLSVENGVGFLNAELQPLAAGALGIDRITD